MIRPCCALLVGFAVVGPAAGQRAVTLEEALELFFAGNPSLHALRADVGAEAGLARQAAAWPNPELSLDDEPAFGPSASLRETTVAVAFHFEWPGLRAARIAAAERSLAAARERAAADSLRLAFSVIRAYVDAAASDERVGILHDAADAVREAERILGRRFDEGEASGLEVHRMRVERARHDNELMAANAENRVARMELAQRARPDGTVSHLAVAERLRGVPEAPPLDDLVSGISSSRRDVRAFRDDALAARAALRESRRFRLPQPAVGVGFKRRTDGASGLHVGASVSLPVLNRHHGTIERRIALLRAAEFRELLSERRAEAELRQAHDRYVDLKTRMATVGGELVTAAEAASRSARAAYDGGEATLRDLMDAAAMRRDARIARLDILTALWNAYLDILYAAGRPLPTSLN